MGFFRRLFGSTKKGDEGNIDPQGIYFYVECDKCGAHVRVRADKQYDLNQSGSGYVWHKTIVDNRCFQRMQTIVHLDRSYNVSQAEIEGGHYISKEAYQARLADASSSRAEDQEEEAST